MRKLSLIMALALVLAVFAGCSGKKEKTKLIMATEAGFRPYEYRDEDDINKIIGVDVDIANIIAEELGLELEIVDMEFNSIIEAVKSGKADFGAAGISINEERLKSIDFTMTYVTSKQVILTKKDSGINGPDDIVSTKNAVQGGTVADFALTDDYPDNEPLRYNKYLDALADLQNGRVDCIVLDFMPAIELEKSADNLVILDEELFTDEYAICVSKENKELLESINKVLERLISEGKIEEFISTHLQ